MHSIKHFDPLGILSKSRIAAKPESLKYLWELMTLKNTPLINELLAQVPNHPDFERGSLRRFPPQRQVSLLKNG